MVESATEFRKNGFNDDDSAQLALVAATLQNVADEAIDAGEAASFLIAQMTAFDIGAENARYIVDSVNAVSNAFSVSSGDLINNLGNVSAALSTSGNSWEETLGLMTAGTEVVRNAAKVSRGLVSVQSRLNQIVDESSSVGKSLTEWYEKHNIAIYDQDGQLRTLYDILTDVSKIWGTLSKNEQAYYLNQQAGANQTQNLAAILSNFQTALDATSEAYNSTGSAAQENSRYMESLEAKTVQLKATFQDLSNNVIDSELVKSLLDLANSFLGLVNTPVGQFVTQIGLLTGAGWGLVQLLKAMNIVDSVVMSFKRLALLLPVVKGAMAGTITTTTLLNTVLATSLPLVAGLAAAFVAFNVIAPKVSKWWKNLTGDIETMDSNIQEATSKLEANKSKLEELNNVPYDNRTSEINEEIEALERENAELQNNIDKWNEKKGQSQVKDVRSDYAGEPNITYDVGGTGIYVEANNFAEAIDKANDELKKHKIVLRDVEGNIIDTADALVALNSEEVDSEENINNLMNRYAELNKKLQDNGSLTADEKVEYVNLASTLHDYSARLQEASDNGGELSSTEQTQIGVINEHVNSLIDAANAAYSVSASFDGTTVSMDGASFTLAELTSGMQANSEQVELLKAKYPEFIQYIKQTETGFMLESNAILTAAASGDTWAIAMANTQKAVTEQYIKYARIRMRELYAELQVYGKLGDTEMYLKVYNAYYEWDDAIKQANASLSSLDGAIKTGNSVVQSRTSGINTNTSSTKKNTSATKDNTDAIKEQTDALKEQLSLLDDRAWFLEQQLPDVSDDEGDEKELNQYADLQNKRVAIFKEAQIKIHALAEAFRAQGMSEDDEALRELGKLWWQYENDIRDALNSISDANKDAAERAQQEWEDALEAQIEALEEQQSIYEKFFSYMEKQIDKEIAALQEERDKEEEYWDAKIDALEAENDAIERQIELEQLQNALAQAKQTKVMVYKDGRFQYIEDLDAINEAQTNLESYQREEALRQEVENLEQLKNQALASIDEQIQGWEEYKEQWSSVVEHYQEEQDRLIIEQELGIELEGELWKERLDNLEDYVEQYEALLERLAAAQSMANSGLGTITGNKKPGQVIENPGVIGGGGGSSSDDDDVVYPVGPGHSGGVTNNDGSWSPFPGGPVYRDDDDDGGYGGGSSGGGSSSSSGKDYPDKPSQDISDEAWHDYIDSGGKYSSGTFSANSGISLVGEEGPELRLLNSGDGILPADITKNLWAWGAMTPSEMMNNLSNFGSNLGNIINIMIDKFNPNLPNVTNGEEFATYLKQNFWRTVIQNNT